MSELIHGIVYVELADASERWIEILRVGEFLDSKGRPVKIEGPDLDVFVTHFEEGAAGQEVPIDIDHEWSEAAGWVKGLKREGDILKALPDWNELGRKLVGDRVYRYVSASLDLVGKIVKSVSLVNFPAVKGLAPLELSEGVYALRVAPGLLGHIWEAIRAVFEAEIVEGGDNSDESNELANDNQEDSESPNEEGQMDEQELREEIRQELLTELEQEQQTRAEMRQEVRQEVEAEMRERFERRQTLRTFAEEITSGDAGLSASPDELVEFLVGLDEDQAETAQTLLRSRVVDFSERGSDREGESEQQAVPVEIQGALRSWVNAGHSVAEFFEINQAELGEASQYDLSEYEEGNDG